MEAVHEIVKGKPRPACFNQRQPKTTLTGAHIKEIPWALPYLTESICPICKKVIRARKFAEEGRVFLEKDCVEHGHFKTLISSDVDFYMQIFTERSPDGCGILNPDNHATACPDSCGICNMHHSGASVARIEVPAELTLEEAVAAMSTFLAKKPSPARFIWLDGKEAARNPSFFDMLSKAKGLGFRDIIISDESAMSAAGKLGISFLFTEWASERTLTEAKRSGVRLILSPSTENAGEKVRFAYANKEIIKAVFFRLTDNETIADLAKRIEKETDHLMSTVEWYSLSSFPFFSTCHPDCGAGGYIENAEPKRTLWSRLFGRRDYRVPLEERLFVGTMNYQNAYDFDIERAKRCMIHSSSDNGRIVPLCALTSGIQQRSF